MNGERMDMSQVVTRAELIEHLKPLSEMRTRLYSEIDRLHTGQSSLATKIDDMKEELVEQAKIANGRTAKNEAAVIAATTQIEAVQETVTHLETHGCRNLGPHQAALGALTAAGVVPTDGGAWKPTPRQVGIGAGLVGAGAGLVKIAEVLAAWLQHLGTVAK